MSVLERSALVDSPLADLHAIASELSIDGYRRLRRPELIEAILERQGNARDGAAVSETDEESAPRRRRGRRGGRGRAAAEADADGDALGESESEDATADASIDSGGDGDGDGAEESPKPRRSRSRARAKSPTDDSDAEVAAVDAEADAGTAEPSRPTRGRRGRGRVEEPTAVTDRNGDGDRDGDAEETVQGVVELLPNGSGFVRVAGGVGSGPSDDDVYISAAQVKRCELVSGDTIAGPKRAPRRSERFASLIRIETINGRPASELADSVRFDDLPACLPTERITVGSEDPTLEAIEWLTPFGRGSRVTITGGARAGKSEALRRLAAALADSDEFTVTVALAGARPEEISEWGAGPIAPTAAVSLAASEDAQAAALEPVVDQARRLAARGEHAVVLIDGLDGLSGHAARRLMASARCIVDGGSVTLIATATQPVGGETTVIALDVNLTAIGRFPALDLVASGTLRPELLVGEAGAESIARTRAEVSGASEEDED